MKRKRSWLFRCAAAALALAGYPAAGAERAGFSDVPETADYAPAVDWCVRQGLMNGVGGGRFAPDATLTRGMLATVLYRRAGEPALAGDPLCFRDVEPGQWYTRAVHWANSQALIRGCGNGVFGVADPVSVEQLAVILDRCLGKGDTWAGDPARAAAATRAQVAAALMEAFHTEAALSEHTGDGLDYLLYTPADAHAGMPQLPSDLKGWSDALSGLSELLDEVCRACRIDTDRISLTGHLDVPAAYLDAGLAVVDWMLARSR